MTLNDICRMLKLANVHTSKVIQTTYPQPAFVVIVPNASYFVVANVVGQLKLRTDNVTVKVWDNERDVRAGEHLYIKVTGDSGSSRKRNKGEGLEAYQHRRRALNQTVVIDCVSVAL